MISGSPIDQTPAMGTWIQIGGAVAILVAFVSVQRKWLDPTTLTPLVLNTVGSGVLAVDAWFGEQWGFVLLEAAWFVVSVAGLVGWVRRRPRFG